ncbi:MAG: OPT/YSL family transporter [Candidatus Asgardarchaeia archaeon]
MPIDNKGLFDVKVIMASLLLSVIYTFIEIYLQLKVGLVILAGVEVFGYLTLSFLNKKDPKHTVILISIVTSSALVNTGILVSLPAIEIFSKIPGIPKVEISPLLIVTLSLLSGITGLMIIEPMKESFIDKPWPHVRAQVVNIEALNKNENNSRKPMLKGLIYSTFYNGIVYGTSSLTPFDLRNIPYGIGFEEIPQFIGINNSPLMVGIGFFSGFKRTFLIAIGSLISFLVWFFLESGRTQDFGTHIMRPEIFYMIFGVVSTTIILDSIRSYKKYRGESISKEEELVAPLKVIHENLKRWKLTLFSLVVFYVSIVVIFSILRIFENLYIDYFLALIGIPLSIISAFFMTKMISETGIITGYISDAIAVPAIVLFSINFPSLIIFMTLLSAMQDASISLMGRLILGRKFNIRDRDVFKASLIGTLIGTFLGSMIITIFANPPFGFGTHEFPCPNSELLGLTVLALLDLRDLKIPLMDDYGFGYIFLFIVAGCLTAYLLTKKGYSPIPLAVGLLIPPSYGVIMLIGGIINLFLQNKGKMERYKQFFGGVIAGEGITVILWILMMILNINIS